MRDSELKGFLFSVFPDGKTGALLDTGLWPPAHGITFGDAAVFIAFGRATNPDDAGGVACILIDQSPGFGFAGDGAQFYQELVAIQPRFFQGLGFASPLAVAE